MTSHVVTQNHTYPNPYKLFPGQKLLILERDAAAQTQHRVVAGETLQNIAHQHRIQWQDLQAVNPEADLIKLVPGSLLRLPNGDKDMTS